MAKEKTYLLDRNVVIDIRNFIESSDARFIKVAKSIDRPGNVVSPMLSVIEGKGGATQSADEMRACLLEETELLDDFYERARTDSEFLRDPATDFAAIFSAENRKHHEAQAGLARDLIGMLGRTFSVADARGVAEEVWIAARMHSVDVGHPLVLAAIACLYGNADARRILKPRATGHEIAAEEVYNCVADFRLLSNLNYMRSFLDEGSRVKLVTRDAWLQRFSGSIRLRGVRRMLDEGELVDRFESAITVSRTLVPNIEDNDDEWDRFIDRFQTHHRQQHRIPPFKLKSS